MVKDQFPDFDEEGRKLFKKLGLPDPLENLAKKQEGKDWLDEEEDIMGRYGVPDVVYVHPVTKAKFYIGDETAASSEKIHEKCGIYHIVNAKGD